MPKIEFSGLWTPKENEGWAWENPGMSVHESGRASEPWGGAAGDRQRQRCCLERAGAVSQ